MFDELLAWFSMYKVNVLLTLVIIIIYGFFKYVLRPRIIAHADHGNLKDKSKESALAAVNVLLLIGTVVVTLFVWGFDFKGLLALSASILAVTGVALFAGWSVLSNITSFFILLVQKSFRRGNFVRVIDGDNYVEGYISEINLFSTKLISEAREVIIYPNNLLLTRPMLVNPRDRLKGIGKLQSEEYKEDKQS